MFFFKLMSVTEQDLKLLDKIERGRWTGEGDFGVIYKAFSIGTPYAIESIRSKIPVFCLMELNNGKDLYELSEEQPKLQSDETQYFLCPQICGAVRYLRDKNSNHIDIKPENILVCKTLYR